MLYNHNMRIFLFVINGLGIGSLPDYSKYNQEYYCTINEIGCADELVTLNSLGLKKCCLEDDMSNSKGYFFRGRMLATDNTFEGGLNEILGNVTFGNKDCISENLVTFLKKKNIKVHFASSREGSIADKIVADDKFLTQDVLNVKADLDDGLVIGEFDDFAKFACAGNVAKMKNAIMDFDNFLGDFISSINYDDIVFVSGNFGVNHSKIGITREYNPIFVFTKFNFGGKILRTIQGNHTIAMSIVDMLGVYPNGENFLDDKVVQKIESFDDNPKKEVLAARIDRIKELRVKSFFNNSGVTEFKKKIAKKVTDKNNKK